MIGNKFWRVFLSAAVLQLSLPLAAWGAETVTVNLPSFSVTLNEVALDAATSQYPCLVYKDITYIPMTYEDAQLLGLVSEWNDTTGLRISKSAYYDSEKVRQEYTGYPTASANAPSQTATVAEFAVTVMDKAVDNTQEEFPLLVFRDVTYFPLTWRFAVEEFGWQYDFTEEAGLVIKPPVVAPKPPAATGNVDAAARSIKVTGNVVNIREKASTESAVVTKVQAGDTLDVLGVQGDWYQVLANGQMGWIAGWLAEPVSESAKPDTPATPAPEKVSRVQVTGNVVNIREKAATESAVVTKVQAGDILDVLNTEGQWYQVLADGQIGWIAGWLVEPLSASGDVIISGNNHALTAQPLAMNGAVTTARFAVGQNNNVKVSSANDHQVVFAIDNNNTEHFQPPQALGAMTNISAVPAGSKTLLTLDTIPNAVVTAQCQNGLLTVTARDRYANGGRGLAGKIIVVDPGHGDIKENGVVDPGTIGLILGYTDREVGFGIGDKLRDLLEAAGATVIMTREEAPSTVGLSARPVIANEAKADAFVSIHGNALENNTTKSGAEVYYYANEKYLTPAAQKAGRKALAEAVNAGIIRHSGRSSVVKDFQNYLVLRETECISILVEAGYLSNAEDEALLATDAYQQKMAQGIFDGLAAFFS